jgi:hypothetical protein
LTLKPCSCLNGCVDGGEDRCIYTGKPLPFDHEESIRNRKLAQHEMRQRDKADQRIKDDFETERRAPTLFPS